MRRMLDVDIPGKRRRVRPNLRWKDAYKEYMREAGLKENNATNGAKIIQNLTSNDGQASEEEEEEEEEEENILTLAISSRNNMCLANTNYGDMYIT